MILEQLVACLDYINLQVAALMNFYNKFLGFKQMIIFPTFYWFYELFAMCEINFIWYLQPG